MKIGLFDDLMNKHVDIHYRDGTSNEDVVIVAVDAAIGWLAFTGSFDHCLRVAIPMNAIDSINLLKPKANP